MNTNQDPTLRDLAAQLARIEARLDVIDQRQRSAHELVEELAPIGREMIKVGGEHLATLEARGYFAFAEQMMRVLDNIVVAYDVEDLEQLGDNVVRIVDTVKNVTQPDILHIANEATNAVHDADGAEPKGLLGMLTSTRDKEVKKGLAVALEVLRHVGRAANRASASGGPGKQRKLAAHLAPRLAPARSSATVVRQERKLAAPTKPMPVAAVPAPAVQAALASFHVDGFVLTDEGFLADAGAWTPAFAEAIAPQMGVELTDAHRGLIEFVRADYAETGVSPNVRRIGKSSPVSTKDLYAMFPKAPAIQVARLAGLPKPAGCI